MTHYVLVHGAWEGAWSWNKTIQTLDTPENQLTIVALPGSPENPTPLEQVTMAAYVQAVIDAIGDQKVVLVGHSLAGGVISNVAEIIPEKIERLVYVTAFLLKAGDTILAAMQRDPDGEFLPELHFAEDMSHATADAQTWRAKAFHDVPEDAILKVLPKVVDLPQSTEPFMAPITVTKDRFGTVPKTYIRTSIDKMVSPKLQAEMLENWDVDQIHILESGHFPTLSMPEQLAALLR